MLDATRVTCYYHASPSPISARILNPSGYYENVDERGRVSMWYPVGNASPVIPVSRIAEVAFSKSIGGSILGSFSGARKAGTYHVYATVDAPDIDLSQECCDWLDFDVTEEVRFRHPVPIVPVCAMRVSKREAKSLDLAYTPADVGDLYGEMPPDKDAMIKFRNRFTKRATRSKRGKEVINVKSDKLATIDKAMKTPAASKHGIRASAVPEDGKFTPVKPRQTIKHRRGNTLAEEIRRIAMNIETLLYTIARAMSGSNWVAVANAVAPDTAFSLASRNGGSSH